tara:strand:- start:2 stop:526 length:525 start_codon:yes stop_codon:yes gene_type:complete
MVGMSKKRQKDDFYPTPLVAVESLLDYENFEGDIWEPACGDGAISQSVSMFHNVVSTDLNDFGFGNSGIDFLMEQKLLAPNIITNPPYKLAQQFIQKAIDLGAKKHCWLLRLSFLEGQHRRISLFDYHKPARVLVFSQRLTIWRGDEEPNGSGATAYAWFVWDGKAKQTKIDWL